MSECVNCGESPAEHDARSVYDWDMEEYTGTKLCDKCYKYEKDIETYLNKVHSSQFSDRDFAANIVSLEAELAAANARIEMLEGLVRKLHSGGATNLEELESLLESYDD